MANGIQPIMQIGKGGVSKNLAKTVSDALEARELIKLRVLDNSGYSAKDAAGEIAEAVGCEVVACVGSKLVLYRESEKKKRIEL